MDKQEWQFVSCNSRDTFNKLGFVEVKQEHDLGVRGKYLHIVWEKKDQRTKGAQKQAYRNKQQAVSRSKTDKAEPQQDSKGRASTKQLDKVKQR